MRALLLAALLAASGAALGCGYCFEDKIASTYDHALVARALAQGRHVAYFHIDGPLGSDEATARALRRYAESIKGVDKGSVRFAAATLTLAFAFDPRRVGLAGAQAALERRIASRRLTLMPLLVVERPEDLRMARR